MSSKDQAQLGKTEVSAVPLSVVRLLFGVLMFPQIFHLTPHIHQLSNSTFVFHYPYLSYIEAYSHGLIDVLAGIAAVGAGMLALGLLPRIGAFLFMCCFGYLFLIDMAFYNNHYYLWCLVAFVFTVTDTHKTISVIDLFKRNIRKTVPVSSYVIMGLLVSIVYFYGGIAKINYDWLQGQPMRLVTKSRHYPYPDLLGYFLSYVGLIFDLTIPFILWFRPKAWYVVLPYFVFHTSNYFLFNIGEFPLVMMALWLLFPVLASYGAGNALSATFLKAEKKLKLSIYIAFITFQVVFPLRFLIMLKGIAWHRQGHYFAWRMMLHNHEPEYFQYTVSLPDLHDEYEVNFAKLITYRQLVNSFNDPYFIWQLAQKLHDDAAKKYHTNNVKVYCNSVITLNHHPARPLIKPDVDLAAGPYHFYQPNNFINY